MSLDLMGRNGPKSIPCDMWADLLDIAQKFGWKPIGTDCPEQGSPDDWEGSYNSSDGQFIVDSDAKELGRALRRYVTAKKLEIRKKKARDIALASDAVRARQQHAGQNVILLEQTDEPPQSDPFARPPKGEIELEIAERLADYFEGGGCMIL